MSDEQYNALEIARSLDDMGVPIFRAPSMRLPLNWQKTEPFDHGWRSKYKGGDGLGAVMGTYFDAVDIDPRNGGDRGLLEAIEVYGIQLTPRGGVHGLIRPLGIGKHTGVLPGVDLQGGKPDGSSRGFIWIAPTARNNGLYRWESPPIPPDRDDRSGDWLRHLILNKQDNLASGEGKQRQQAVSLDPPPDGYLEAFWREVQDYQEAPDGSGGDTWLFRLACRVREFANAGWVELDYAMDRLDSARIERCGHTEGQSDVDWHRIMASSRRAVGQKVARRTELAPLRVGGVVVGGKAPTAPETPGAPAGTPESAAADRKLKLVKASSVKIKRVRWLRHDRIPLGEITLVAGREGTGKSIYLAHMAARVTRGDARGEFDGRPRGVIIVASEDSWAHTVAPRLRAAGADLDLVYNVVKPGGGTLTLPDDTDELVEVAIEADAGAIMLDPVISLINEKYSTDRARELRLALEPLRSAAEEIDAAIMALVHFNKNEGDVLTKIAGSRGWVEVARAVLGIAKDDTEEHMVLSQIKNNLGRLDLPNWAYNIHSQEIETDDGVADTGRLEWVGKVESGVAELLASRERGRPRQGRDYASVAEWVNGECSADGLDGVPFEAIQRRLGEIEGWSERTTRDRLKKAVRSGLLASPSRGVYGPVGSMGGLARARE